MPRLLPALLLATTLALAGCAAQPTTVVGQASPTPAATTAPAVGTSFTAAEQDFLVAIANEPSMSWGEDDETKLRVGYAACAEGQNHSREQVIAAFTREPNPWPLPSSTIIVDQAKVHLCPNMPWGAAAAVATAEPAAAAPATIGDGTYEVGVDIEPGKYKTTGPADPSSWPMCYWARLKNTSGELSAIIANDNIKGQTTVTIKASDGAFESTGCAPWVKVG